MGRSRYSSDCRRFVSQTTSHERIKRSKFLILEIDKDVWTKEAEEIEEHYKKFGDKLPKELREQLETLKANLK